MTPRYAWTPASEPPDTRRTVVVWYIYDEGGDSGDWGISCHIDGQWQGANITHWRDVEPPEAGE